MGRWLVGVLLVAALAGSLWLWSGERGRGVGSVSAAVPDPVPAAAAGVEPAAQELDPAEPAGSSIDAAPATHATREAREREPGSPAPDAAPGDLFVRVVDPSGAALAGIPLRLERGTNPAVHDPGRLVTDADGRARFPEMRPVLETAAEPWTLLYELPFGEPPRLALDRAALAGSEVVAVLPWGGALEVVVREIGSAA